MKKCKKTNKQKKSTNKKINKKKNNTSEVVEYSWSRYW